MKKILILGGTGFVGRILSECLTKTDYSVTLFNRSKRNPSLFPEFSKIIGDRNTDDIFKITDKDWDVVIDFSGFFPDNIEIILSLLSGNIGRYIFVSSASVYDMENYSKLKYPIEENSPILTCTYEQRIDKHPFNFYGNKKAECERILQRSRDLDVIIFRPALIYGRYDPTDRFYYWLYRSKKQDQILLPEDGKTIQTNTYSEDFALILQEAIDIKKHQNVYNAITHSPISIKDMVYKMLKHFNREANVLNAPEEFLMKNNLSEWVDIPLWIKSFSYMMDNSALLKDFSVKLQTFETSIEKTADFYDKLGWNEPKDGISISRENELIHLLTNPVL